MRRSPIEGRFVKGRKPCGRHRFDALLWRCQQRAGPRSHPLRREQWPANRLSKSEPAADPYIQSWRNRSMSKFDLTGRKALVTGGARGLGAGMAAAIAKAGAAVMIGDVLIDVGRDTAKAIAAGGAKAGFVAVD